MVEELTQIGLTEEAKIICNFLAKEVEGISNNIAAANIAVAHAITKEIDPKEQVAGTTTVWGVATLDAKVFDALEMIYADECAEIGRTYVFRNLVNRGLLDLGADPNFEAWETLTDLPGFSSLEDSLE